MNFPQFNQLLVAKYPQAEAGIIESGVKIVFALNDKMHSYQGSLAAIAHQIGLIENVNSGIIASTLAQLGFVTRITGNGVIVSLNRVINTLEVEIALAQEFEGIEFQVSRISKNRVLIEE